MATHMTTTRISLQYVTPLYDFNDVVDVWYTASTAAATSATSGDDCRDAQAEASDAGFVVCEHERGEDESSFTQEQCSPSTTQPNGWSTEAAMEKSSLWQLICDTVEFHNI